MYWSFRQKSESDTKKKINRVKIFAFWSFSSFSTSHQFLFLVYVTKGILYFTNRDASGIIDADITWLVKVYTFDSPEILLPVQCGQWSESELPDPEMRDYKLS